MPDREKVIKGLECCASNGKGKECIYKEPVQDCPYEDLCVGYDDIDTYYECTTALAADALELLKEQENCVSIPFTWLVKFCTHLDFHEPMSDEDRAVLWKKKLNEQLWYG